MNLTLKLAGISVSIDFLGNTGGLLSFYRYAYQKFLAPANRADARMTVRALNVEWNELLPPDEQKDPAHIRLISNRKVAPWIGRQPDLYDAITVEPHTIAVTLLNGLLIYLPDKAEGHIILSNHDPRPYRPIYHLLWVFFSQVLGDRGACFVHAAGVALKGEGVLFLGGPGEGKSTVAGLCRNGQVLSDDSPILWGRHDACRIFPSPVHQLDPEAGPGNAMSPDGVCLNRIFFLLRDDRNAFEDISIQQAFFMILTRNIHFFQLLTESARVKLFDLFYNVCHKISVGYLHFRKDADVESLVRMNRLEG